MLHKLKTYYTFSNKNKIYTKTRIYNHLIDRKFFIASVLRHKLYKYVYNRYWVISFHNLKFKYTIHKGQYFNKLKLTSWLLKTKFGIYSITRKPFVFVKKEKKKKR